MELKHPHEVSNEERRRAERPVWRRSWLVSLLLHTAIFAYFPVQSILIAPDGAAGPQSGDDRAARGSMEAMNMRVAATRPRIPPPIPLPTLTNVEPVEFDDEPVLEPAAIDGDALTQGTEDLGLEDGDGAGDGGSTDEGRFLNTSPKPRSVFLPSNLPRAGRLRGERVEVWVFVDARGQVIPDSTQLRPPTRYRDFNRSVIRTASEWSFDPGLREGRPVASWFTYSWTVGG